MRGVPPCPPTLRRAPARIPRAAPALRLCGNVLAPIILGDLFCARVVGEWGEAGVRRSVSARVGLGLVSGISGVL